MPTTMQIFVIVRITNQLTARIIIMPMVKEEATSPRTSNGTLIAPNAAVKVSTKCVEQSFISNRSN